MSKRLKRPIVSLLVVIYLLGGTICNGKMALCFGNDGHTVLEVSGSKCCKQHSEQSCAEENDSLRQHNLTPIESNCECCIDIGVFIDTPVFRSHLSSEYFLKHLITVTSPLAFGQAVTVIQNSPPQNLHSIAHAGGSAIGVSLHTVILLI